MRTFMRWMPDPPTEVDRGNGVTQFLYPPIEDTGEIIKTFPINESKRIIQFPERKPARKKTLGWIFLTAIMAMYVFGLVFLKELLFWHDGILYKPVKICAYGRYQGELVAVGIRVLSDIGILTGRFDIVSDHIHGIHDLDLLKLYILALTGSHQRIYRPAHLYLLSVP